MLKGKKILLGVTGSIAAYKSAHLVRLLVKAGAEVRVIMTPSSTDFISRLTLSTLSKNKVLIDLFDEESWANHVMLGRWADVMLLAPLSCNTLAKMANGFCDNLLLAVYLSATHPVVIAPAMDEDMWHHSATKENVKKLIHSGVQMISVEKGELASGLTGEGRMAEPETIIQFLENSFFKHRELEGKKALVSAGPTYEPIDPVRFIGNHSSGKMGIAIAEELARNGATVTLILGPTSLSTRQAGITEQRVTSASEMYEASMKSFATCDIAVLAAAVADFTPQNVSRQKIKKGSGDKMSLSLVKTKDILKALGNLKRNGQVLAGFALETENEMANAKEKLQSKNLDFIVMNSLREPGAGFSHDTNRITIIDRNGSSRPFPLKSKQEVAADIVNFIIQKIS